MIDLDTWMGSVSRSGDAPSLVPLITPHLCSLSQASSVNAFTLKEVFLAVASKRYRFSRTLGRAETRTISFDYALRAALRTRRAFHCDRYSIRLSPRSERSRRTLRLLEFWPSRFSLLTVS